MINKIVIITGANSGIGKAATIKFAKEGYAVVMACRNLEKSKKIQEEIIQVTKNNQVDLLNIDLASFQSIKDFCSDFKNKYDKLDILIHNAGHFNHGETLYQLSEDHIELTFMINTVGPYLLTQLLKEDLKKADDPRILHACSTNIRYFFEPKRKIEFDNLQGEFKENRPYNSYKMYGDSKMALLMLTFKMADVFKKDRINVNAVQIPAIKLAKESIRNLKLKWRILATIQRFFSALPETMADTYYDICTSKRFNDTTGKLINIKKDVVHLSHYGAGFIQAIKQFFDKEVYPKYARNKEYIDKIWHICEIVTKG